MNSDAATNRVLIVAAGAMVSPWLDKHFGIQMSPVDTATLLLFAYHYAAKAGQAGIAAFKLYFPPPNPMKPVEPAKVPT